MFQWSKTASAKSSAKIDDIWALWSEVKSWPSWDDALEWAKLNGKMVKGQSGLLKPKGWPVTKFKVVEVDPKKKFQTMSKLPFTTMTFEHQIEGKDGDLTITHKAAVKGLFAPMLKYTMGRTLEKDLLLAINKCSELAGKS